MRSSWCLVLIGFLGAGGWSWAVPQEAPAGGGRTELEAARQRGALLFRIHCATCHGTRGLGDGPLADDDLEGAPANLTSLASRGESGEGEFPTARIAAVIDGREVLDAHGNREMPVWGLTFQDAGRDTNQETAVSKKIDDLIEHLRTLQAPDTGSEQLNGAD